MILWVNIWMPPTLGTLRVKTHKTALIAWDRVTHASVEIQLCNFLEWLRHIKYISPLYWPQKKGKFIVASIIAGLLFLISHRYFSTEFFASFAISITIVTGAFSVPSKLDHGQSEFVIAHCRRSSTRRFRARPSSVMLESLGRVAP